MQPSPQSLGLLSQALRHIRPPADNTRSAHQPRSGGTDKHPLAQARLLERLLSLGEGAVQDQPSDDDIFWSTRARALRPIGTPDDVDLNDPLSGAPGRAPAFGTQPMTPFRAKTVRPFAGMRQP